MKNILKKVSIFMLLAAVLVGSPSMSVNAGQAQGTSSGKTFSQAWKATASNGNGSVTYGYNTAYINEDYAWAYHSKKSHYAAIKNGNGWHYGKSKSKGDCSKIEVKHCSNGTNLKYQCNW